MDRLRDLVVLGNLLGHLPLKDDRIPVKIVLDWLPKFSGTVRVARCIGRSRIFNRRVCIIQDHVFRQQQVVVGRQVASTGHKVGAFHGVCAIIVSNRLVRQRDVMLPASGIDIVNEGLDCRLAGNG